MIDNISSQPARTIVSKEQTTAEQGDAALGASSTAKGAQSLLDNPTTFLAMPSGMKSRLKNMAKEATNQAKAKNQISDAFKKAAAQAAQTAQAKKAGSGVAKAVSQGMSGVPLLMQIATVMGTTIKRQNKEIKAYNLDMILQQNKITGVSNTANYAKMLAEGKNLTPDQLKELLLMQYNDKALDQIASALKPPDSLADMINRIDKGEPLTAGEEKALNKAYDDTMGGLSSEDQASLGALFGSFDNISSSAKLGGQTQIYATPNPKYAKDFGQMGKDWSNFTKNLPHPLPDNYTVDTSDNERSAYYTDPGTYLNKMANGESISKDQLNFALNAFANPIKFGQELKAMAAKAGMSPTQLLDAIKNGKPPIPKSVSDEMAKDAKAIDPGSIPPTGYMAPSKGFLGKIVSGLNGKLTPPPLSTGAGGSIAAKDPGKAKSLFDKWTKNSENKSTEFSNIITQKDQAKLSAASQKLQTIIQMAANLVKTIADGAEAISRGIR